jgi:membrane fusion protein
VGLFRSEALSNQQRDWLGSIQLIRPVSLAVLTGFVVLVAAAVAAYLMLGEYTRKARVSGYLVPDRGLIRLMAPQAATVIETHAAEGQSVHRGDVLFVLAVGQTTPSGDAQTAIQGSLARRERSLQDALQQRGLLEQNQAAALDLQINNMRHELSSIDSEASLQRERLALAQQALTRLESLRNDNFVSSAQVQTKTEELLGLKAQLQSLDRQRGTQLREIATLEAQRRELPMRARAGACSRATGCRRSVNWPGCSASI